MKGTADVRWFASLSLLVFVTSSLPHDTRAQIRLEWELGMAWVGRNDVTAPREDGTMFSLVDGLSTEPGFAQRIRVGYLFGGRHEVSLLYVPFRIQSDGEFDEPVDFNGITFQDGLATLGKYRMNAGRLRYRFGAVATDRFELRIGASAALRDSKTSLENQAGVVASKSRLDVLPLAGAHIRWFLTDYVSLMADGEGTVLPSGRVLDALAALDVEPADRFRFRVGYRVTENIMDSSEFYNSLLSHQAVIGISLRI
jgi:hypothetical protein